MQFERAPKDDPHQCQGSSNTGDGRCPFMAMKNPSTGEYLTLCPRHGGHIQIRQAAKQESALYDVAKWNARILRMEKHPQAKSLTAELAVLRLLLENRLAQMDDMSMLAMSAGSLSELVVKIEKVVRSIHHIDKSSGLLLDRDQVEFLANTFVKIVCAKIEDPDILEEIINETDQAMKDMVTIQRSPNQSINVHVNNIGSVQGYSNSRIEAEVDQDV